MNKEKLRWFFYFFCKSMLGALVVFVGLWIFVGLFSDDRELNESIVFTIKEANESVDLQYWIIKTESIEGTGIFLLIYLVIIFYWFNIIPFILHIFFFLYQLLLVTLNNLPLDHSLLEKVYWFYYYSPVLPLFGKCLFFLYELILTVPIYISMYVAKGIVFLSDIDNITYVLREGLSSHSIPYDLHDAFTWFSNYLYSYLLVEAVVDVFKEFFFAIFISSEVIFDKLTTDFILGASFLYPIGLLGFIISSIGIFSFLTDIFLSKSNNKKTISETNRLYKNYLIVTALLSYNCIFLIYFFHNIIGTNFLHHKLWLYDELIASYYIFIDKYSLMSIGFLVLFVIIFIKITSNNLVKMLDLNTIIMLILSIFAINFLVQLSDLFLVYLGIVALSLCLYPLISLDKKSRGNLEAVTKYFFLGALASAVMLFGLTLIYRELNTVSYEVIKNLDFSFIKKNGCDLSLMIGLIFIMFGFFFKLSIVPLQNWTPDVYLGSPTVITCFLATIVKFGVYCAFIRSYYTVFINFFQDSVEFKNLMLIFSIGSIVVGAVGALDQFKIKRFLGFATINQMGFILLGLSLQNIYGFVASYVYLCIYILLNLIFFLFILNIKTPKGEDLTYLSDLVPFFKTNKTAGIFFILLLFSLAGMPPTVGFYMKVIMLKSLIISGYVKLTLILLYVNVISIFYYARIIKIVFFDVEGIIFKRHVRTFSINEGTYSSFSLFKNPFSKVERLADIFKDWKLFSKFCIYTINQVCWYGLILFFLSGVWYHWAIYSPTCLSIIGQMWSNLNLIDYDYISKGDLERCIHYFLRII